MTQHTKDAWRRAGIIIALVVGSVAVASAVGSVISEYGRMTEFRVEQKDLNTRQQDLNERLTVAIERLAVRAEHATSVAERARATQQDHTSQIQVLREQTARVEAQIQQLQQRRHN